MKNSLKILFIVFFALAPSLAQASEEKRVACALHIHSSISSGAQTILTIAERAREENIDAIIITDLLAERYECGLKPFQKIIRAFYKRPSILDKGAANYLAKIKEANEQVPGVLTIDGAAVTPFYFWTGSLFKGSLTLNNRAKDLLVLGLGDAKAYETLPAFNTGYSAFDPYHGDKHAAPYQTVIDDGEKKGGLVFWSHPGAEEHITLRSPLFNLPVRLESANDYAMLFTTSGYTGSGMDGIEVRNVGTEEGDGMAIVGGHWDRLLLQYASGRRKEPVWAIGEVDYNGYPNGIHVLAAILNMLTVEKADRASVLDAIAKGHNYLIIPDAQKRRLQLDKFYVTDGVSAARMGGELKAAGPARVEINLSYENGAAGEAVSLLLIKNGVILKQWDETLPVTAVIDDVKPEQKGFYRFYARTETGARLLTNPVFVSPSEE